MKFLNIRAVLCGLALLLAPGLAAAQTTINLGNLPVSASNPWPSYLATGPGTSSGNPLYVSGGGGGGGGTVVQGAQGSSSSPWFTQQTGALPAGSNLIGNVGITGTLPLPAGAATSALQSAVQNATGTQGTTALTIQGSASGYPVPVSGTLSASIGGFAPNGVSGSLSATTTVQSLSLTGYGAVIEVTNSGSNPATVALGSTASASTTYVPAGATVPLAVGSNTSLSYVSTTSTTTLSVQGGAGLGYSLCCVTTGGGGGGTSLPVQVSSTNGSGTITTGGTFQTLLALNTSRKGCFVQNPATATELLYVYVYSGTAGSPTVAASVGLGAGASFNCSVGGYGVITDQIAVEAATTGHAFVEINQ